MPLETRLSGREEKRLLVMMNARIVVAGDAIEEKAYVENISERGARVYAYRPRQLGDEVTISPTTGEGPVQGDVIYCRKLADGRFVIGLRLQRSPALLSILERLKA